MPGRCSLLSSCSTGVTPCEASVPGPPLLLNSQRRTRRHVVWEYRLVSRRSGDGLGSGAHRDQYNRVEPGPWHLFLRKNRNECHADFQRSAVQSIHAKGPEYFSSNAQPSFPNVSFHCL